MTKSITNSNFKCFWFGNKHAWC